MNYVPKEISSIIEDYYHPYRLMYDEVVKQLNRNTQHKEKYDYAQDKVNIMIKNPIWINEHRSYNLKKMGIDGLKKINEGTIRNYKEWKKRYKEQYLQSLQYMEDDMIDLTNLLERESNGEEVINRKFWDELEKFNDMVSENAFKYLRLHHHDDSDDESLYDSEDVDI